MIDDQSRLVPRASAVEALTQIRALCDRYHAEHYGWDEVRAVLDAVPVDATPAQGIDRDALHGLVHRYTTGHLSTTEFETAVVALVRPVEGVVLTRVEARLAGASVRVNLARSSLGEEYRAQMIALAARLEASS